MVSEFSFLEINYFVPFHFFSIGPRYVMMNHHNYAATLEEKGV